MSDPDQWLAMLSATDPERGDNDPLRAAILDAARTEFELVGVRRANVGEIARRAKVSRQTLYRRFQDKDSLVAAVGMAEVQMAAGKVRDATAGFDDPTDIVAEAIVTVTRGIREHILLNRLRETEPEALYYFTSTHGPLILALTRGIISEHLLESNAPAGDVTIHAELLARLLISLVLIPDGLIPVDDEAAMREFARNHLLPQPLPDAG
ncbi:TetR/AcrR family transcriptional regulator [Nocardia inohanensis]|uniref:TetR/AcrR family transcriptional regulator n=1 Tax=Nocardia inohanensis TaxID=209246 RepID=UPI000A07A905|nr:TetR/AcrR family transcriptional regulator [Nocardia inohanensis]